MTAFNKIFDTARLNRIAGNFGTPLYVYDESVIRNQCRYLKSAFDGMPVRFLYAVKANDNPHILQIMHEEGMGYDTVSYEEVLLCRQIKSDPMEIFYTENNMTDQEMDAAVRSGVILNIGSLSRLKSFLDHPVSRECSIRLNPGIGDGHHYKVDTGNRDSKFGIRKDLIPECAALAASRNKKITGLHLHIGSGIRKPENLISAMGVLIEQARYLPDLRFINFGGGMPVPYREGAEDFDLLTFARLAREVILDDYRKRDTGFSYYFEPGRWFIAQAGALLTRVNTIKNQGNVTYLGTDTGLHHLLRPALYDAYHAVVNLSRSDSQGNILYTIAGNICESGDILATDRSLPETAEGDLLAICDTGAYGMTMASHYNRRALPAEVLLRQNTEVLIRARMSAAETVDRHLRDTGFL
ncbi:MAG: diaminopimelate decarboxylase [Cyclonatronaceae bacterium]